jgi:DNA-directed RNA polymerase specialized sigma24 family protein
VKGFPRLSTAFENTFGEHVIAIFDNPRRLYLVSSWNQQLAWPRIWHYKCFSLISAGETKMLNISDVDRRTSQGPVTERALTARRVRHSRVNETHATPEDFQQLFAMEMTDLFGLSFRLTADAEKAESCLILAMRECFDSSCNVSKKWVRKWVRRAVIRNAIRQVLDKENTLYDGIFRDIGSEFPLQPSEYRIEELQESLAILELPDLDRLVFVICVLERYSILDCALLMSKSPKEVNDARVRATNQVIEAEGWNHLVGSASVRGAGSCREREFDGSCGTLLD